ncbi:hypothetical protein C8A01DRAFT_15926 [Parachaetomium inaequale]|uniref:Uncharacterized protein n=1 Tax=Parachaetomium inaequale TaxID=2588326 RepID=A0AAN6SRZ9_9PEZI|nr:hypothetical protein C8A01DRAFT_15926 [Parachaetomium inaequale]
MASDNFPGPFPKTFTQADSEFILLAHHLYHSKSCVHCQTSILNTFHDLSLQHNTGLQLSPAHLMKMHLYYPPETAQRVQVALDEILAWAVDSPTDFEALLHDKWLALFESAAAERNRNPAEEWLTKLWLASGAGEYTVSDLARGRPFAGMRGYAFEGMHLRQLVAAQRPLHACGPGKCAWDFLFRPWLGSAVAEGLHHAVVMRHTDKRITDVYERFCEELVARGEGARVMPLARMWEDREFQERLAPLVRETSAMMGQRPGRFREAVEVAQAAMALVMME